MSYLLDLSTELKVAIIGTLTGALATIVGGGAEILIVPLLMGLGVVKILNKDWLHLWDLYYCPLDYMQCMCIVKMCYGA